MIKNLLVVAVGIALCQGVRAEEVRVDPDTGIPVPMAFVFPDAQPFDPFWAKRETGYVVTRNGNRLRYSVLLPKVEPGTKVPVILSMNGYDAGSIGGLAYRKYKTAMSVELDKQLLAAGYAVMGVNAAGTACSGGKFEMLKPSLGQDGADVVDFAGQQSWSSGNVGMVNWSYGGSSQVATAANQPKHLRAIAPGNIIGDLRSDVMAPGGVPQPGFANVWRPLLRMYWGFAEESAKDEQDAECLNQIASNRTYEDNNSVVLQAFAHPSRDKVSDLDNASRGAKNINVPVLSFETFQDQATSVRGDHYQRYVDPKLLWLVQSNGAHDIYLSKAYHKIVLSFFDRFVKGTSNGFEQNQPRTLVWMDSYSTGKELFNRDAETVPGWLIKKDRIEAGDIKAREFHLGADGSLNDKATSGSPSGFDYPGEGPSVGDLEGGTVWGALPEDWKNKSLAFTSAPLERDMMVYGPGSADLWMVANAGDADVQVTVTEVRPDGQEMYVQRGWLRLSQRALDQKQSTPLLPVRTDQAEDIKPTNPGEAVLGRVEIGKMAHMFSKGSKLRIWIDTPSDTGGFKFNAFGVKQKLYVLHNQKYDSVVRLGELSGVTKPPSLSTCGEVLSQPCRMDPLGPNGSVAKQ
ncbi:CocE/NonD family hydrolase [Pantoea sp. Ap-967]|uniref:CocE/NonD family hydrolase n=1 Tax=Pantoea sp. Ap-967 TaxID=2608362 RepID=UPI001422E0B5|nr:CocE/NonD family hydrolase [Pantoea sp. Ap-967]NIE72964.1 CocE/NonD family hydrolase [Pantoea sp. Ap-967]